MTTMTPKSINDFTDAELAQMIRESVYAKNTRFGNGKNDSRFLLVLAVPYGQDEDVTSLGEALESFRELLTADDWQERCFQVYDYAAPQHYYQVTAEEAEPEVPEGSFFVLTKDREFWSETTVDASGCTALTELKLDAAEEEE